MGNTISQLTGHLVDIDPQGQLRLRYHHTLRWDEVGRIDAIEPAESDNNDVALPFIFPGAIDCHVHFPQTKIIGGYGKDLLDWLDKNVWPEEKRFADDSYATDTAAIFLKQLFKHGTTSALVFGSQFVGAMDTLFSQAHALNMCLISGLTLQDRHTDPALELTPQEAKASCEAMIKRWHKNNRLRFAVTSRFSPACTEEMLQVCQELLASRDDLYFQTHINESASEIEFVKELFPHCKDYLATYEQFDLVGQRSVLAHSVHPSEDELRRMGEADCSVAHCPSSNGFLGSGAFSYLKHLQHNIRVGIGTDVGAGVSFSMWNEMQHAHLMQMRHPFQERRLMTGEAMLKAVTFDSAHALHLLDEVGNFEIGKWADLVTIDESSTQAAAGPLFAEHLNVEQFAARIFRFAVEGTQDRIASTRISGKLVYERDAAHSFPHFPQ